MKNKKQMSVEQDKKIESSKSYLRLKQKFNKLSKIIFLTLLFLFFSTEFNTAIIAETIEITPEMKSRTTYLYASRQKLHRDLVKEVDSYIRKVAPDSELDANELVNNCIMYDIDIPFVLAQGVLESHFGTKGKAAVTKSVWNVGTYDDGTIKHTYSDVNESIEPYLRLIKEKYLGENKQINDLLKDNGFKTLKGHRYASLDIYESLMRSYVINVNLNTSITMYQQLLSLSDDQFMNYFTYDSMSAIDTSDKFLTLNIINK